MEDVPLRSKGEVWITLGPDRRAEPIGTKGEATFVGIPANFRGQTVPLWVEAEGFAPANPAASQRLDGSSLDLAVKRLAVAVRGRVQNGEGRPIPGANVRLGELATQSDAEGTFLLNLSASLLQDDLVLSISAPGYEVWHGPVVPRSNDVVAVLRRSQ